MGIFIHDPPKKYGPPVLDRHRSTVAIFGYIIGTMLWNPYGTPMEPLWNPDGIPMASLRNIRFLMLKRSSVP